MTPPNRNCNITSITTTSARSTPSIHPIMLRTSIHSYCQTITSCYCCTPVDGLKFLFYGIVSACTGLRLVKVELDRLITCDSLPISTVVLLDATNRLRDLIVKFIHVFTRCSLSGYDVVDDTTSIAALTEPNSNGCFSCIIRLAVETEPLPVSDRA